MPIEIIHEFAELHARAVRIKAENRLSLADSWIAAIAQLKNATLVHKDPKFSSLSLKQKVLPPKTASDD